MSRRGFTLLEVMLALVILMALLAVMSQFTWSLGQGQQRALDRLDRQAAIDAIIDRVSLALDTGTASVQGDAGFRGDSTSLHMFLSQDRPDSSHAKGLGAQRAIDIEFDQQKHAVQVSGGEMLPLGDLQLRFYNGEQWQDSFDSVEEGGLPTAVLVEAWLHGGLADASEADIPPDRRRVMTVVGAWRQSP